MKRRYLIAFFLFITFLSGCGGGGGDDDPIIPPPPSCSGSGASPTSPYTLTVGSACTGSIDAAATRFAEFTTGGTASPHTISLTGVQSDLSWELYSDPGYTSLVAPCDDFVGTTTDESCPTGTLAANTTYYLQVFEWDAVAGTYTILVEDSAASVPLPGPITLTVGTPYNDSMGAGATRDFDFTTGGTATTHTISLTGVQSDLRWRLYSDPSHTSLVAPCENSCTTGMLAANATYYLQVLELDGLAGTYTVLVEEPITLTVGMPYNDSIGAGATKAFDFTTGGTASTHTISLTGVQSDLSWELYSDPGYTSLVAPCDDFVGTTTDESCPTGTLAANTTYYLQVFEWDAVAGTYTVLVDTP